ncbi:hypothetical protein [Gemmatimonas sp.]
MRSAKLFMAAFMALVLVMLYLSATAPGEPAPVSGPAGASSAR